MFKRLPGGMWASLCWSSSLVSTDTNWVSGCNWLSQLGSRSARAAMRSTMREPVPPMPTNRVGMIVPCPGRNSSAITISLPVPDLEEERPEIVAMNHSRADRRLPGRELIPLAVQGLPPERGPVHGADADLAAVRAQPRQGPSGLPRQLEVADVDHGVAIEAAARAPGAAHGVGETLAHLDLRRDLHHQARGEARRRPEAVDHEGGE